MSNGYVQKLADIQKALADQRDLTTRADTGAKTAEARSNSEHAKSLTDQNALEDELKAVPPESKFDDDKKELDDQIQALVTETSDQRALLAKAILDAQTRRAAIIKAIDDILKITVE